jgi:hypothetical protein
MRVVKINCTSLEVILEEETLSERRRNILEITNEMTN